MSIYLWGAAWIVLCVIVGEIVGNYAKRVVDRYYPESH